MIRIERPIHFEPRRALEIVDAEGRKILTICNRCYSEKYILIGRTVCADSPTLSTRDDWTICGEAADGKEAVILAVEQTPDFIILDFSMPRLSGIQAAAEILKIMPRVPIVLYTLYDDPHTEAEAKKVGIRKVISKTKSLNLVADLEEILGKAQNIGPLGISDGYAVEPTRGEDSVTTTPRKPPLKPDIA